MSRSDRLKTLLIAAASTSCIATAREQDAGGGASEVAVHAIQHARLLAVMRDMDDLLHARLAQEYDEARRQQEYRSRITAICGDLAASADQIPLVLEGTDLGPPHREKFIDLARQLRDESLKLARLVQEDESANPTNLLNSITASCQDCHSRFRVLPILP